MSPLVIRFTGNRNTAYVSGNGARGVLLELRGRAPMWSPKHRAFVTTEATAKDALALAEARRWHVRALGTPEPPRTVSDEAVTASEPAEVGLW